MKQFHVIRQLALSFWLVDFGFFDPTVSSVEENMLVQEYGIQIYPNPAQSVITFESEINQYRIELFDSLGKLYQSISINSPLQNINIAQLPKGLYLIKVFDANNKFIGHQKLVKQ